MIALVPPASVASEPMLTAPANVVVPPVLTVRSCAPVTVPPSVTAALPLLVRTVAAASVTSSLKICDPVVVIVPLSCVVPPPALDRLSMPVKLPSMIVGPEKMSARSLPLPVTVEANVPVAPVSAVSAPSVTASP